MRHFHALCVKITRQMGAAPGKTRPFWPIIRWHLLCYKKGKNWGS